MGVLSKIKLFSFEKKSGSGPTGINFGTNFETKSSSIEEKRGSKNRFKKGSPPRRKQDPITRPGGSWRRGLACAFSTTKTTVRTATAATTATIAETGARIHVLFEVAV